MIKIFKDILEESLETFFFIGYNRPGYLVRRNFWEFPEINFSMKGKICLVTGGNSGIGKASVQGLAGLGADVIFLCRDKEKAEETIRETQLIHPSASVQYEEVDLSLRSSIKKFTDVFIKKYSHLDVLVNNAGVFLEDKKISPEGLETTFATNTLAYHLLSRYLEPLLRGNGNARIINVTSGGMYLTRLDVNNLQFLNGNYSGLKAYAQSKRAEVDLSLLWSKYYAKKGVTVNMVHPGWVDTPSLSQALPYFYTFMKPFLRTPKEGADTIIWMASKPDWVPWDTSKLYFDREERKLNILPNTNTPNGEKQILWDYLEALVI
ncbi:MAG: SDR family NAD(P)-dependent oxidoreductase [Leptospiraceae bacterium]|nr:SDR family NAD(P)-dependent oxidoreductase [Leptospiraceae bacterium]MCP5501772.1 SDR family NAD(P)-dependent oxidoreductase [Leptospiraceae bacterium]